MADAAAGAPAPAHDVITDALLRHRRVVTSVVVLLVFAATLFVAVSLLLAVDQPWTGLTMTRTGEGDAAVVRVLGVARRSPAATAAIRAGDVIRTIDGIPAADGEALLRLHDSLRPGRTLAIRLERDGVPLERSLVVGRHLEGPRQWAGIAAQVLTVFALFYGLATLVYRWRPGDPRALLFMMVSAAIGTSLLAMVIPGGMSRPPETVVPLPEAFRRLKMADLFVVTTSGLLSGPLLLHFVLLFPRPRLAPQSLGPLLGWSYLLQVLVVVGATPAVTTWLLGSQPVPVRAAVMAAIAAAALAGGLLVWRRHHRTSPRQPLRRRPLAAGSLVALAIVAVSHAGLATVAYAAPGWLNAAAVACFVGTIVVLGLCAVLFYPVGAVVGLWSAWTVADATERQQIRWPLLGIGTTLTTAIVLSLGTTVWSFRRDPMAADIYAGIEVITWVAYLLIPLSFAMAILRYGLMDIRVIIRLTFIYAVASAALAMASGAVVVLVTAVVSGAAESGRLTTILLTLLVVGMVEPVRRRIQQAIDVRFYQQAPDPAGVLARHGEALRQVTRREELERRLMAAMQEAVPHRPTIAFRAREGRRGFDPVAGGSADVIDLLEATRWLDGHHATLHGPIRVDEAGDGDLRPWQRLSIELLLPVRHADSLHLVVAAGRKRSDENWSERDLELMSSLAAQSSMAIGGLKTRVRDASMREAFDSQQALLPQELPQPPGYTLAGAWHPALPWAATTTTRGGCRKRRSPCASPTSRARACPPRSSWRTSRRR